MSNSESRPRWVQRFIGRLRSSGQQIPQQTEAQARDAALDLLEDTRSDLVGLAFEIALRLCREYGEVSATAVWVELRRISEGDCVFESRLANADPRWMGAVFRESRGWKRLRHEPTGSHKRLVPVWTRSIVE